jgi:hypothetical protein
MRNEMMRMLAALAAAAAMVPAFAEESFDACAVFTQEDASRALGMAADPEPVNPKAKRPKMVPVCTYRAVKDGNKVAATVTFHFGKTNEEVQRAFEDARMRLQTKPLLISGADAFWSAKTGEMTLRKGRTWMTVAVGPAQITQRELNDAKRLAEALAKKL